MPVHVLITAGPTAEDIDPVRFITNRSSGRMGMAVAVAARAAGFEPVLVLGPTAVEPPEGVETARVRSAADMLAAVVERLAWADWLVMTAAVADYTPAEPLDEKLKKADGDLVLRLRRTKDILREVAARPERGRLKVVGFSLDVGMNLGEGRRKLAAKNLDYIVVNTAQSFGADRMNAAILAADGGEEMLGDVGKDALARRLLEILSPVK